MQSSFLHSAANFSWWQLGVAAFVLLLVTLAAHRWMVAPLPWRQRVGLLSIRLVWSLALLWCLWQPTWEVRARYESRTPPNVVLLVDVSASMAPPRVAANGEMPAGESDRWTKTRETIAEFQAQCKAAHVTPTMLACGARLRPYNSSLLPEDKESQLLKALGDVAGQSAAPGTATMLFTLTDGQDTSGSVSDPTFAQLRQARVHVCPIVPSGLGEPASLARVERLTAPNNIAPKTQFDLKADLRVRRSATAPSSPSFSVLLKKDGQEVDRKALPASTNGSSDGTSQVTFTTQLETPGLALYSVMLQSEDTKMAVSSLSTVVRATEQRSLRVLYAQGSLDWEYRFVRQAVQDNPNIKLDGLTRLNPGAFLRQTAANNPTINRSDALAALHGAANKYDVIVLSNFNPDCFDNALQNELNDLVLKRGGGILFFSGNAAQASRFHATQLEQLLPVVLQNSSSAPVLADSRSRAFLDEAGEGTSGEGAFAADAEGKQPQGPLDNLVGLKLTPLGLASDIFRNAAQNTALAQPPATFLYSAKTLQAKPAALVLGVHPSEQANGQPMPLLAVQNIGAGRSAFLGVDALWRWRMRAPAEARDYDRFWQQLLLWLGGRAQFSSLECDRGRYRPGENIQIRLRQPLSVTDRPKVFVRLSDAPESQNQEVALSWSANGDLAVAQVTPTREGQVIFSAKVGNELRAQQVADVRASDLEADYTGLNQAFLAQLASSTQGQLLRSGEVNVIGSLIKSSVQLLERQETQPLWQNPWIFALILGGYLLELLLRHRYRLT